MTLKLILIRHAKSDWGDPTLPDHDRPLNKRGRRDAPRIGAWLARNGYLPTAVTVSSARRAQETWQGIKASLDAHPQVSTDPELYHADPETLMRFARRSGTDTHLMIAHNPGMAEFARRIVEKTPTHPRFADFPTCSTLVLDMRQSEWCDVGWQTAQVLDFITPHDLPN